MKRTGEGHAGGADGEIGQGQGKTSKSPEKERERRRSVCGIAGYVELREEIPYDLTKRRICRNYTVLHSISAVDVVSLFSILSFLYSV